ncbi:MAG: acyltransferase [Cytophaga sp.]|nr:acyltransferase [Undibacterium sp.]
MTTETFVYKIGDQRRPSNGRLARLFLSLNRLPLIRNLGFVKWGILKSFKLPKSTTLNKDFYCSAPNITVGENVSLADVYMLAYAPITIGKNSGFSFRNILITSTHDINNFSTVIAKPIIIGDNVWITTNVTILPGVTIGDGSIIGAGSVVTGDIPAHVFAAGNPCRVIKKINFTMR